MSLIIAGLAAKGEAIIGRAYHLNRAFERIEEKRLSSKFGASTFYTPRSDRDSSLVSNAGSVAVREGPAIYQSASCRMMSRWTTPP